MSPRSVQKQEGIRAIADLLRSEARNKEDRKIGIEIERIGIWPDCTPFGYQDTESSRGEKRPGAKALLEQLSQKYSWPLLRTPDGDPVGLKPDSGQITLEPGSQLELSTEASRDLHSLVEKVQAFECAVDDLTLPWGLTWIGLGVNPCNTVDQIDLIPSVRYAIMTDYLGKKAPLATSMMRLTSSVQINLDYQCEAEAIEMLQAALAATPISYALFSNSPLKKGIETGLLSYRYKIWSETDPDRTGLFPEAFATGFDFNTYASFLWDYPLMFAQNTAGKYVPANGQSLDDIAQGKLPGVEADETNRISAIRQLFTEARIKPGYVEVRSVDGQPPAERYAAAAFWMGVLYDAESRRWVLETFKNQSPEERENLLQSTIREGLHAKVGSLEIYPLARDLVKASKRGLEERGFDEARLLSPLEQIIEDKMSPAERVLETYREVPAQKIRTVLKQVAHSCPD